jgi:hypothetical protein
MIDDSVFCPYCLSEQSDYHNGGESGRWRSKRYFPEGALEHKCECCGEIFKITVDWIPSFDTEIKEDTRC